MSAAPPASRAIWCIGGAVWDRKLRLHSSAVAGSSNPVSESATPGGVARNVAHNLRLLGLPAALLTRWGEDAAGQALRDDCARLGLSLGASSAREAAATGSYTAVLNPDGSLCIGLAQMEVLDALDPEALQASAAERASAPLQLADMNLRQDSLQAWLAETVQGQRVLLAVSEPKMQRLPEDLSALDLLIANAGEWQAAGGNTEFARRGLRQALVTQGRQGVRCGEWQDGQWRWQRLKAEPLAQMQDATGAGDAFSAGVLAALHHGVRELPRAAAFGQRLSTLCLQSLHSVAPEISPSLLQELPEPTP